MAGNLQEDQNDWPDLVRSFGMGISRDLGNRVNVIALLSAGFVEKMADRRIYSTANEVQDWSQTARVKSCLPRPPALGLLQPVLLVRRLLDLEACRKGAIYIPGSCLA